MSKKELYYIAGTLVAISIIIGIVTTIKDKPITPEPLGVALSIPQVKTLIDTAQANYKNLHGKNFHGSKVPDTIPDINVPVAVVWPDEWKYIANELGISLPPVMGFQIEAYEYVKPDGVTGNQFFVRYKNGLNTYFYMYENGTLETSRITSKKATTT